MHLQTGQAQQRKSTMLMIALMLLGTVLRVWRLGTHTLWLDEAFSLWLGRQSIGPMLDWIQGIDQHPPLYYLLLHTWVRIFGESELALRLLSAYLGILIIPVCYRLSRSLAGPRVAGWTALLVTIAPFQVYFAQEVRIYTLLALLAGLALISFVRILSGVREGKVAWAWVGYVLFSAAALWTHNTALFLPLAVNAIMLTLYLVRRWHEGGISHITLPPPGRWVLAQCAILAAWAPWLPVMVRQSAAVYRHFWIPAPTLERVLGTLGVLWVGPVPLPAVWTVGVALVWAGLVGLGIARLRTRPTRLGIVLALFLIPFGGELLVSLWRPIFYDRTLIWISLLLYILLGAGIAALRRWRLAWLGALLVVFISGRALYEYHYHFEKEAWDAAAALVTERAQPGDVILFNAAWVQIPFDYYYQQYEDRLVAEHGLPVDLFERGELEPQMTVADLPRLRTLASTHERVWLVYSHAQFSDPHALIPDTLAGLFTTQTVWSFEGIKIYLYGNCSASIEMTGHIHRKID